MRSLYRILTVIFTIMVVGLSLGLTAFSVSTSRLHTIEVVREAHNASAANTASALALALKLGDLHTVQSLAESFGRQLNDGMISVKDQSGETLIRIPVFASETQFAEFCSRSSSGIAPVLYNESTVGTLEYCFANPPFRVFSRDLVFGLFLLVIFGAVFSGVLILIRSQTRDVEAVLDNIRKIDPANPALLGENVDSLRPEMASIVRSVRELVSQTIFAREEVDRLRLAEGIANMASQVSHDICSSPNQWTRKKP